MSRRSKRPAQSDDASGAGVEARGVGEALQRAHEHGQLEIGGRDAVGTGLHAGAREHRACHSTSSPRARAGVPRAALGLIGLELEQVAAERDARVRRARSRRDRRRGGARPRGRPRSAGCASPLPQRSSSRQNASAAASHARELRRSGAAPSARSLRVADEERRASLGSLTLRSPRENHRPPARSVVDQLPDRVVQVLLEQLDLGDVVGEPAPAARARPRRAARRAGPRSRRSRARSAPAARSRRRSSVASVATMISDAVLGEPAPVAQRDVLDVAHAEAVDEA